MTRPVDRRAAVLLMIAVAVAGCTQFQPSDTGEEPGVEVTSNDGLSLELTPSERTVDQGDRLVVDTLVRNTGESDASVNGMQRYGATAFSGCSLPQDRRPTAADPISLRGALASVDRPGGQVQLQWTCQLGLDAGLTAGESDRFTFGVAATYEYTTTARTSFAIDGEDVSPIGERTSNTGAPVHATLSVPDPAPLEDRTLSIPISLANVGDGEVDGPVSIDLDLPTRTTEIDCPDEVELVSGGRDVLCSVEFPVIDTPSAGTQVFIRADLRYNYTERTETTVEIRG